MRAIRIHSHGSFDSLKIENLPNPTLKDPEVLVQIKASGLNHLDIWIRQGMPGATLPLPLIPGSDASGEVVEAGKNVKKYKPGHRVFIIPGRGCGTCSPCKNGYENLCLTYKILGAHCDGTHRELIALSESDILPLPSSLSFEEGAAFPLVFATAWHMLIEKAQLKKDETILIIAGASGLGTAAIQIAKAIGARIITTVGNEQAGQKVCELGANKVINHYQENIEAKIKTLTNGHGVAVIIEHVGTQVWNQCLNSLSKGGRLVCAGTTTGGQVSFDLRHLFSQHKKIIGSTMGTKNDLIQIIKKINQGELKPIIHKILPYQEIQQAHQLLEKGGIFGKIVLNWNT